MFEVIAFDATKKKRGRRSCRRSHANKSPFQCRRRKFHNKRRRRKYRLHHIRRAGVRRKSRKVLSKDEVSFSREEIIVPPDFIFVMRKYLSQNIPLSFNVSILLILIGIMGNILWISPSFLNHSRSLHMYFIRSLSSLIMFQESWELIHSTNYLSAAAKSEYILHTFQIITEVQILNPYLCPFSFSQSLSLVHTRAYMCLFHSVS